MPDDLTDRDHIAFAALVGMGQWMPPRDDGSSVLYSDLTSDEGLERRARWAYRQADAMLKVRKE